MPPPDASVDVGVAPELEGSKAQPPWSALPCRFRFVPKVVGPLGRQRREERKVEDALP
jgi:hypothetical protein